MKNHPRDLHQMLLGPCSVSSLSWVAEANGTLRGFTDRLLEVGAQGQLEVPGSWFSWEEPSGPDWCKLEDTCQDLHPSQWNSSASFPLVSQPPQQDGAPAVHNSNLHGHALCLSSLKHPPIPRPALLGINLLQVLL